jgi:hypothetical protein
MSGAAATSPIVDRVTRIVDLCPLSHLKFDFRIINWFLIVNTAIDPHLDATPAAPV